MNDGLQRRVPIELQEEWEAIRELQSGGQAAPILLRHRKRGEHAVLKILKGQSNAHDPERINENRERLAREITILQNILHPNIVNLKLADASADPPWYVSPYGEPLTEYWGTFREASEPKTLFEESQRIVLGLLNGLSAFHSRGGVHRDIKPQNVILLENDDIPIPVLIDFGIAYIPNESRITKTDGKTVANNFIAPSEALYGKMENPPAWWDCLGIIWLWSWMLMDGRGPKYFGRYASGYHVFIPDDRCKLVRSIWKVVELEEMGPKNAAEMLTLLRSVGLDQLQTMDKTADGDSFDAARGAWQREKARNLAEGATVRQQIDGVASILGSIYDPLRERIEKLCDSARLRGLPVSLQMAKDPSENLFRSHVPGGPETILFKIQCGIVPRRLFTIRLYASYEQPPDYQPQEAKPVPHFYPFAFTHLLQHDGKKFPPRSTAYWHAANGEIRKYGIVWSRLDPDHVFAVTSDWLSNPELWKHTE